LIVNNDRYRQSGLESPFSQLSKGTGVTNQNG
jgi:hypothetical protein